MSDCKDSRVGFEAQQRDLSASDELEAWYVRAFRADYLKVYRHRGEEQGNTEVAAAAQWLQIEPGHAVLDLCCGAGRHLRPLEESGARAVGFDLSADLLKEARRERPHSLLVRGDMRQLPFVEAFEAVCSFFTSFGYFFHRSEHLSVLHGIARGLKRRGRFLIDLADRKSVAEGLVPRSERRVGELHILEQRWLTDQRVEKKVTVTSAAGNEECYHESVRLFELAEITELCHEAGLSISQAFGSFDGVEYKPGATPRMILVGGRP